MDRLDPRIQWEPLQNTVDPDNFTPRLLALLSNALVWRESNELRRRFGLGTNDWRVISVLALNPGFSATEVSEFIGVNKAVVSKSVNTLVGRDLIVLLDGPRGSRPMYLTTEGVQMHDDMLPISMRGQDIVLPTSHTRKSRTSTRCCSACWSMRASCRSLRTRQPQTKRADHAFRGGDT